MLVVHRFLSAGIDQTSSWITAEVIHGNLLSREQLFDARKFLLNSVDEKLEKQLHKTCKDDDTFITYWMQLMSLVRPISVEQYERVKNHLKERNIKDYSGENVEDLASDFLSDWKELDNAGMYDHNLMHDMLVRANSGLVPYMGETSKNGVSSSVSSTDRVQTVIENGA